MRVAAFIPARGGSTRLPGKNLAIINGRSLIRRAYDAAIGAGLNECDVVLSTDDAEIAAAARAFPHGCVVHDRPPELATATADVTTAIAHWYDQLDEKPDAIVLLNPTSPFRTAGHVAGALALLEGADTVVSITLGYEPHFGGRVIDGAWAPSRAGGPRVRTQDLGTMGYGNGAIFAFTRGWWEREHSITGGLCRAFPMAKWDSTDIDTQEDLDMARRLAGDDR